MNPTDQQLQRLTDKQRDCLRLVADGCQEKEIARLLSTTPAAIKERLRAVRELLGVSTSRQAARLFAAWQEQTYTRAAEPYTWRVDGAETLAGRHFSGALPGLSAAKHKEFANDKVMEQRARFEPMPVKRRYNFPWPWPMGEKQRNDLSSAERITASLVLTAGFLLGAGIAITAVVLLMNFLRSIALHGG